MKPLIDIFKNKKTLIMIMVILLVTLVLLLIPKIFNQEGVGDRGEQAQHAGSLHDSPGIIDQTDTGEPKTDLEPFQIPNSLPLPDDVFLWVWPNGAIDEDTFRTGPLFSENRIYVTHNLVINSRPAFPMLYINGTEITRDAIYQDMMDPGPFIFSWDFDQGPGVYNAKVVVKGLGGQFHQYDWQFVIMEK